MHAWKLIRGSVLNYYTIKHPSYPGTLLKDFQGSSANSEASSLLISSDLQE